MENIQWIFDGIGTEVISLIVGLTVGGVSGYKIGVRNKAHQKQKSLTDADVRRILQDELRNQGRFSAPSQYISNWRI